VTQKRLDDNLVLIDFEYCAYNYRGFDIANHFCEWIYDYNHTEYPFYKETVDNYPNEEQQRVFLTSYLAALAGTSVFDQIDGQVNTVEHLLEETKIFALATHIHWSVWSAFNGHTSKIAFGYWEYGAARLERYLSLKEELIAKGRLTTEP